MPVDVEERTSRRRVVVVLGGSVAHTALHAVSFAYLDHWGSVYAATHGQAWILHGSYVAVDFPVFIAGLVALSLYTAFKRGAELEKDTVGLV